MVRGEDDQGVIANAVRGQLVDDRGDRVVEPSFAGGDLLIASSVHLSNDRLAGGHEGVVRIWQVARTGITVVGAERLAEIVAHWAVVDGRRHVQEEALILVLLDEVECSLSDPFLVVNVERVVFELGEVRLVIAGDVVEAEGAHPLAKHAVVVLDLRVGRGVGRGVGGFLISEQALGCPVTGAVKVVVGEVALPDHASAVAGLLQPGTQVLVIALELSVCHGETPQRIQGETCDELIAGIARRPTASHQ